MREEPGGSILESVRRFFLDCPLIEEGALVSVDRPDGMARGYAVCGARDQQVVRRYLDGGTRRVAAFDFCVRGVYAAHTKSLIGERRFLDAMEAWIDRRNRERGLPELTRGRRALSLRAVSQDAGGAGADGALWKLRCQLVYYQPAGWEEE